MMVGETTVVVKDTDVEGVVVQLLPTVTLEGTVRTDPDSQLSTPQDGAYKETLDVTPTEPRL